MVQPISPKDPVSRVSGSEKAKGNSQSQITAAKVRQIKLPIINEKPGLGDRQITLLEEAYGLSESIYKAWQNLFPEQLAERIIELEDRVSLFKEASPEVEKIKREAEHLHFAFVFPLVADLERRFSKTPSTSFARRIDQAADRVFRTHSLAAFDQLSNVQKQEVLRIAAGRKE